MVKGLLRRAIDTLKAPLDIRNSAKTAQVFEQEKKEFQARIKQLTEENAAQQREIQKQRLTIEHLHSITVAQFQREWELFKSLEQDMADLDHRVGNLFAFMRSTMLPVESEVHSENRYAKIPESLLRVLVFAPKYDGLRQFLIEKHQQFKNKSAMTHSLTGGDLMALRVAREEAERQLQTLREEMIERGVPLPPRSPLFAEEVSCKSSVVAPESSQIEKEETGGEEQDVETSSETQYSKTGFLKKSLLRLGAMAALSLGVGIGIGKYWGQHQASNQKITSVSAKHVNTKAPQRKVQQVKQASVDLVRAVQEATGQYPLKGAHVGSFTTDGTLYVPFAMEHIKRHNNILFKTLEKQYGSIVAIQPIGFRYGKGDVVELMKGTVYGNGHVSVREAAGMLGPTTVALEVQFRGGVKKYCGIGTVFP